MIVIVTVNFYVHQYYVSILRKPSPDISPGLDSLNRAAYFEELSTPEPLEAIVVELPQGAAEAVEAQRQREVQRQRANRDQATAEALERLRRREEALERLRARQSIQALNNNPGHNHNQGNAAQQAEGEGDQIPQGVSVHDNSEEPEQHEPGVNEEAQQSISQEPGAIMQSIGDQFMNAFGEELEARPQSQARLGVVIPGSGDVGSGSGGSSSSDIVPIPQIAVTVDRQAEELRQQSFGGFGLSNMERIGLAQQAPSYTYPYEDRNRHNRYPHTTGYETEQQIPIPPSTVPPAAPDPRAQDVAARARQVDLQVHLIELERRARDPDSPPQSRGGSVQELRIRLEATERLLDRSRTQTHVATMDRDDAQRELADIEEERAEEERAETR
jgi:hypothetical protein